MTFFDITLRVRQARDDDGLVLLDVETGRYFTFDPIGAMVWSQIQEGVSAAGIIRHLKQTFDSADDAIERDVWAILSNLKNRGLIVPRDAAYSPSTMAPAHTGKNDRAAIEYDEIGPGSSTREGFGTSLYWNLICFTALVCMDVLMRFFSFKRLYKIVSRRCPMAKRYDPNRVRRICRGMDRAAGAYFKRAWCLQRSAACVYLLRRRGYRADLVLGVRTFPFEAHAWAELDGKVINDKEGFVRRFLVIDRI
ncbi:MAG: lasso peptide biosynthesis B2 protein [Alphaproteobacteria bacterium]|nr:lasso peptide biosynthesis B2 protein [Alphaproteobacteria bacterium]